MSWSHARVSTGYNNTCTKCFSYIYIYQVAKRIVKDQTIAIGEWNCFNEGNKVEEVSLTRVVQDCVRPDEG
jgi:hypothetical protein